MPHAVGFMRRIQKTPPKLTVSAGVIMVGAKWLEPV